MPIVKCNVSNCVYWEEGNHCNADAILVEIDSHAENSYTMSSSGRLIGAADHRDIAEEVSQTCCHTFDPID
ncbi:MAG TPA: DUF1540 domain-containing protein [Bacillales bacterium]|nr:DUF1540 domain-containing protein [Bacillales bacterium]